MEKARKNGRKSVRSSGNSGGTGYRPAWWRGGAVRKTATGQPATRGNAVKGGAKATVAKRPTKSSGKAKPAARSAAKSKPAAKTKQARGKPVIGKIEFLIQEAPPVSRPSAISPKREFRKSVF